MRVDAGPDDATERVVDDRHVGSGLGDVRMRRRGVLSGGAGLLVVGEGAVARVILRANGAADACGACFGFLFVGADVYRIKLGGKRELAIIGEYVGTHSWTIDELLDAIQLAQ